MKSPQSSTPMDIHRSYSADVFAEKGTLRKAFEFQQNHYITMGIKSSFLHTEAKAYPIFHKKFASEIEKAFSSNVENNYYILKEVSYRGQKCLLGCPVVFKQRELADEEVVDLLRRHFAYGGLFVHQAGSYTNLLHTWIKRESNPRLRQIMTQELQRSDLPQIQQAMRELIELKNHQNSAQLTLFDF